MRRAIGLVWLAGCRAVFGLDPPTHDHVDAPPGDTAPTFDAAPDSRPAVNCGPDTDLVACFEFEGTANDLAPSPNSITAANVSYAAVGVSGKAIVLGTGSRIVITESVLLDVASVTIEAWVYPTQPPAAGGRVGVFDVDSQYALFIKDGLLLSCSSGGLDAGTVPLNQWTHVACTAGEGAAHAYINGVEIAQALLPGPLSTSGNVGGEVGGNAPGGLDRFVGMLDVLRVYRVVRTAQEICEDAHQGTCPP